MSMARKHESCQVTSAPKEYLLSNKVAEFAATTQQSCQESCVPEQQSTESTQQSVAFPQQNTQLSQQSYPAPTSLARVLHALLNRARPHRVQDSCQGRRKPHHNIVNNKGLAHPGRTALSSESTPTDSPTRKARPMETLLLTFGFIPVICAAYALAGVGLIATLRVLFALLGE